MDGELRVGARVVIPPSELSWRFSRSGGPGGQSVNTADTRVELIFDVARSPSLSTLQRTRALERLAGRLIDGVLVVTAEEHRSQLRNRDAARARLAETLAAAIAPPPRPRRPTKPTRGSTERRISEKKRRGEIKRLRRSGPDT
jgi:ribosome-associated protein